MRTVRALPGVCENSKSTAGGEYENSKSIARGYMRTVRASPGVYENSKIIAWKGGGAILEQ